MGIKDRSMEGLKDKDCNSVVGYVVYSWGTYIDIPHPGSGGRGRRGGITKKKRKERCYIVMKLSK